MFSLSSDINPCRSQFFDQDHLRFNMAIISGLGSFAVQFGDHLRSGIICGPGIICDPGIIWGPIQGRPRILTEIL